MRILPVCALLGALFTTAFPLFAVPVESVTPAPTPASVLDSKNIPLTQGLKDGMNKGPTYINSDSLFLNSKERFFEYQGNVQVTHNDMILTSDKLEGYYDDKNQIKTMIAKSNVTITKGEKIKARSQRATYEKSNETLILNENPQLEQNGSLLSADLIRIFLNEDRSVAEGTVRVTLVQPPKEEGKEKEKAVEVAAAEATPAVAAAVP